MKKLIYLFAFLLAVSCSTEIDTDRDRAMAIYELYKSSEYSRTGDCAAGIIYSCEGVENGFNVTIVASGDIVFKFTEIPSFTNPDGPEIQHEEITNGEGLTWCENHATTSCS